jgi:hypothetical protein
MKYNYIVIRYGNIIVNKNNEFSLNDCIILSEYKFSYPTNIEIEEVEIKFEKVLEDET